MSANVKTPVTKPSVVILNGFLGSGKTTLFRNLLAQSKQKNIAVCAIVNDMSELDVDGELIASTAAVEEDNSIYVSIHACVLSSQKGIEALDKALSRLLTQHQPALVIIETSGSCHPMPLIKYFEAQTAVTLVGMFALVDSMMLTHDYDGGKTLIPRLQKNLASGKRDTTNLLIEQIMFASHILFTKADRIGEDKLAEIASAIREVNPSIAAHAVQFGNLSLESLFALGEYDYFKVAKLVEELTPVLAAETQDDTPFSLATRVIKDDRPFHPQRLWDVCHRHLGEGIYRSKGFFWLASRGQHALLWNQAAGGISLEINGTWRAGLVEDLHHGLSDMEIALLKEKLAQSPGRFGDRRCELTVIGDKHQVNQFAQALTSCFLTDEEIALWSKGHHFDDPWPKNIVRYVN